MAAYDPDTFSNLTNEEKHELYVQWIEAIDKNIVSVYTKIGKAVCNEDVSMVEFLKNRVQRLIEEKNDYLAEIAKLTTISK